MSNLSSRPRCTIRRGSKATTVLSCHEPVSHSAHGDLQADLPADRAPRASHLPGVPHSFGCKSSASPGSQERGAERGAHAATSRGSTEIQAAPKMVQHGGR
ncbi:hypothetical protein NDU88_003586 [Pleurodeles waltl]|uniref:Uncharacterized protein n=1 Tax=Pleurodeles waltl TaxID=8319 RepID=A0AAV7KW15_PLEWA|nr:hypothetical protein NDU88_003586 [Pleurodeles waltl]